MPTKLIDISTPDGPCKVEVATPEGAGPWPAVIVFYDAAGLRPAQTKIAERIAALGYLAFQPDLFHRAPPLEQVLGSPVTLGALRQVFGNPERRTKFMAEYMGPAVDYGNLEKTIGALLAHIEKHPQFAGKIGTTGYCMGGSASFRSATVFGNRIAATAAFHPGGLVTDSPESPHLRAGKIKSRVYIGPATGDLPPENEAKLRAELDAGHVQYTIEQYDAKHGYAVEDSDVYDAAAAEKHYAALTALFGQTLR